MPVCFLVACASDTEHDEEFVNFSEDNFDCVFGGATYGECDDEIDVVGDDPLDDGDEGSGKGGGDDDGVGDDDQEEKGGDGDGDNDFVWPGEPCNPDHADPEFQDRWNYVSSLIDQACERLREIPACETIMSRDGLGGSALEWCETLQNEPGRIRIEEPSPTTGRFQCVDGVWRINGNDLCQYAGGANATHDFLHVCNSFWDDWSNAHQTIILHEIGHFADHAITHWTPSDIDWDMCPLDPLLDYTTCSNIELNETIRTYCEIDEEAHADWDALDCPTLLAQGPPYFPVCLGWGDGQEIDLTPRIDSISVGGNLTRDIFTLHGDYPDTSSATYQIASWTCSDNASGACAESGTPSLTNRSGTEMEIRVDKASGPREYTFSLREGSGGAESNLASVSIEATIDAAPDFDLVWIQPQDQLGYGPVGSHIAAYHVRPGLPAGSTMCIKLWNIGSARPSGCTKTVANVETRAGSDSNRFSIGPEFHGSSYHVELSRLGSVAESCTVNPQILAGDGVRVHYCN